MNADERKTHTSLVENKRHNFDRQVEELSARLSLHVGAQIQMCEDQKQVLTPREIESLSKSLAKLQEIGRKCIESQAKAASRKQSPVVLPVLPRGA